MNPLPRDSGQYDTTDPAVGRSRPSSDGVAPVRRRNRLITSCLECRRRKLKCDRSQPCTNCAKANRRCLFMAPSDTAARQRLNELKERMSHLERFLALNASSAAPESGTSGSGSGSGVASEGSRQSEDPLPPAEEDDEQPVPHGMAVPDVTYDDDDDDDDDNTGVDDVLADLGIRMGRLRLTDRIGGYVRPRLTDELTYILELEPGGADDHDAADADRADLAQLVEMATRGVPLPFLEPGPDYIAPLSDMLIGGGSGGSSIREYTSLELLLPRQPAADRLMEQYWAVCHPVARVVHRPRFERRYQRLYDAVSKGVEPPASIQAIVFAALFTAAVSMRDADVSRTFGVDRRELIKNFQLGTERALARAQLLRASKLETLQAFVMYLLPMCRDTISRVHSVLIGVAIRLAECMGLHRDPAEYNCGPVETHVRRLVWYQLCFLDLRAAEAQGPRVTIRRDEFTTKLPVNANDDELEATTSVNDDDETASPRWTDMTFSRIRFECQEMLRTVLADRDRLQSKTLSVTEAIGKIEKFRQSMAERYDGLLKDESDPATTPMRQLAASTMEMICNRFYIALLSIFYNGPRVQMPDRLLQVMLSTATQHLEASIALETRPELAPWAWYSHAYHNSHAALLLLIEVFLHPMRREADRIWRCLDYVLDVGLSSCLPPTTMARMTREQVISHRQRCARRILRKFRDRVYVCRSLRRLKQTRTTADANLPDFDSQARASAAGSSTAGLHESEVASSASRSSQSYEPAGTFLTHLPDQDLVFRTLDKVSRQHTQRQQHPFPAVAALSISGSSVAFQQQQQQQQPQRPPQHVHTPSASTTSPSQEPPTTTITSYGFPLETGNPAANAPASAPFQCPHPQGDTSMVDIDWSEWDKLFPPDSNDGILNLPSHYLHQSLYSGALPMPPDFQPYVPTTTTTTTAAPSGQTEDDGRYQTTTTDVDAEMMPQYR